MGRHVEAPYEAVLGRVLGIRDHLVERTVTASEAFLLHMANAGLTGGGHAARLTMAALEGARQRQAESEHVDKLNIGEIFDRIREREKKYGSCDSVTSLMCRFDMATKLDRFQSAMRTLISPWLVEAALNRLGDKRLSPDEQQIVVAATGSPFRVRWPDWWVIKPALRRPRRP